MHQSETHARSVPQMGIAPNFRVIGGCFCAGLAAGEGARRSARAVDDRLCGLLIRRIADRMKTENPFNGN